MANRRLREQAETIRQKRVRRLCHLWCTPRKGDT